MNFEQALYQCLNQFQIWFTNGEDAIGEVDIQHDGIEHAVVLLLIGVFVNPGDKDETERAELGTLRVGEALLEGADTFEFDGVSYEIPLEAIELYKKFNSFDTEGEGNTALAQAQYLISSTWEELEEKEMQDILASL